MPSWWTQKVKAIRLIPPPPKKKKKKKNMQILFSVLNSCIRSVVAHFVPNVPRGFGPMTLTLHVHLLSTIISNDHNHQPLRMSNELS